MSTNGTNGRPVVPFPPPAAVPLVGQPFALRGFFPTAVIQCNCEPNGEIITLVANGHGACPRCRKVFTIGLVQWRQDQPQATQVGIGIVHQPAPAPAGVGS